YTGPTNIFFGTLVANNSASVGDPTGAPVTVSPGAAFDIAGNTTANNLNFGAKQFIISGTGVGGTGALVNSGTTNQQNAFQSVTLAADASVGGTARMDIRAGGTASLDLATHTLTKVGTNQ